MEKISNESIDETKLKLHNIDLGLDLLKTVFRLKNKDQKEGAVKQAIEVAVKGYGETHRDKVKSYFEHSAGLKLTNNALAVWVLGIIVLGAIFTVVMSSLPNPRNAEDIVGHVITAMLVAGIGMAVLNIIIRLINKFQSKAEAEQAKQELDKVENEIKSKLHVLTSQKKSEHETGFNVILKESGNKKIQLIEEIIELTGLGLKEAKDFIENTPRIVKQNLAKEEADAIKKQLEDSGAVVEICGSTERKEEGNEEKCNVLIGDICKGTVVETKEFGVFVELSPGTEGLCHISELDTGYVKSVEDVCKKGDVITVKVMDITESGKIKLSRKAALAEFERRRR